MKTSRDQITRSNKTNKSITNLGRVRQGIYKSDKDLQGRTKDKPNMKVTTDKKLTKINKTKTEKFSMSRIQHNRYFPKLMSHSI